jgi:hypothetical protein
MSDEMEYEVSTDEAYEARSKILKAGERVVFINPETGKRSHSTCVLNEKQRTESEIDSQMWWERKGAYMEGYALALIQQLKKPEDPPFEGERVTTVTFNVLYNRYAELFDVTVRRFKDGGGSVSVQRASADWINMMAPGSITFDFRGDVVERTDGLFEARR